MPAQPPRRSDLTTSVPGEARQLIDQVYGVKVHFSAPPDDAWTMSLSHLDAGEFALADVTLPGHVAAPVVPGVSEVIIDTVVAGAMETERDQVVDRYAVGDVFVAAQPRTDWSVTAHEVRVQTVTLPESLLTAVAGGLEDGDTGPRRWSFQGFSPLPDGVRQWRRVSRFVGDLLADAGPPASPVVVHSAGRLLAATALAIFPNTAVREPTRVDSRDAHPATLRRALAYIEAHPDLDLTVTDVARAARVTPRAIQLAFRRHLGTTPMEYLRGVRLEHAHRELVDAGSGVTVANVAARWGFTPSRFTQAYRAVYGRLPSSTLRD